MIIDIDAPMEGCNKCKLFDLQTEVIYEFCEVSSKIVKCRNADICRNAIKLYIESQEETWQG